METNQSDLYLKSKPIPDPIKQLIVQYFTNQCDSFIPNRHPQVTENQITLSRRRSIPIFAKLRFKINTQLFETDSTFEWNFAVQNEKNGDIAFGLVDTETDRRLGCQIMLTRNRARFNRSALDIRYFYLLTDTPIAMNGWRYDEYPLRVSMIIDWKRECLQFRINGIVQKYAYAITKDPNRYEPFVSIHRATGPIKIDIVS